jgi:hypothetical protein
VIEVVGQVENDFVSGIGDSEYCIDKTHVGTGGNDNAAGIAGADAVFSF